MSTRSTRRCTSSADADRDLGRDDVRPERGLQRLERAEEVGTLAVEHVHVQHPCDVELGGPLPQPPGADLRAHHRVDHEHRRLADPQRAERVGDEARLARRVEQVDLALAPWNELSVVEIDILRACSSGSASEMVVPSGTEPSRLITPASYSSASCSDVLPAPRWPTRATFLMRSAGGLTSTGRIAAS